MAAIMDWRFSHSDPTVPPIGFFVVTPSDTAEFTRVARGLEATTAGVITVIGLDGNTAPLNFAAGERKTGFFRGVKVTGTATLTGIVGVL